MIPRKFAAGLTSGQKKLGTKEIIQDVSFAVKDRNYTTPNCFPVSLNITLVSLNSTPVSLNTTLVSLN